MIGKFGYSIGELFSGEYDARDEAGAAGVAEIEQKDKGAAGVDWKIHTGLYAAVSLPALATGHADHIIVQMDEWLEEWCGDAAEGEIDPDDDATKVLDGLVESAVLAWLRDQGGVDCLQVTDIRKYPEPENKRAEEKEEPINTMNEFIVGVNGNDLIVMRAIDTQRMTKAQALRHAAWLVAMADENDEFKNIYRAVCNT